MRTGGSVDLLPTGSGHQLVMWRYKDDRFITTGKVPAGTYVLAGSIDGKGVREERITVDATGDSRFDWRD